MTSIRTMMTKFHTKQDGVTALEYALIAALIAVAIIGSVTLVGNNATGTFNNVGAAMPN